MQSGRMRPRWRHALFLGGLAVVALVVLLTGCRKTAARSARSYDEINRLVAGKTADQVLHLLGEPDSRQVVLDADERWIWWNFTYLEGSDYPPEIRGRVVHLEILFKNPSRGHLERLPYSKWLIDDVFGVSFKRPASSS